MWPMGSHGSPALASVQGTLIPSCPTPPGRPDEMEKNSTPCTGAGAALLVDGGVAGEGALQRPMFCQLSGEVLASRKDFRVNTCTPHPRGTFLLEPRRVLMEALQP